MTKLRWYKPGKFYPRDIGRDAAYQGLSKTGKKVYKFLGEKSYLTKKTNKRRYVSLSKAQIAGKVGCSARTVQRELKKMLRSRLLIKWCEGYSGILASSMPQGNKTLNAVGCMARKKTPARYEMPASFEQVVLWRIRNSKKNKREQK